MEGNQLCVFVLKGAAKSFLVQSVELRRRTGVTPQLTSKLEKDVVGVLPVCFPLQQRVVWPLPHDFCPKNITSTKPVETSCQ